MFNLLVSYIGWKPPTGRVDKSRFLTQTDEATKRAILRDGNIDIQTLCSIKAVFMPEVGSLEVPAEAHIGQITNVRDVGNEYEFNFILDPTMKPIPVEVIEELSTIFGVQGFGLSNTHWSVKSHDLFELLYRYEHGSVESHGAFRISRLPVRQRQIAVMMPFAAEFNPIYSAIQNLCQSLGCSCLRGDEIWREDAIIQDVVNLISESKVIICDVTGRNANVFYEAGIAHAMGKKVVLVTQNDQDVPFDLKHLRYVRYLANEQGLDLLQSSLRERLWNIINAS
jgi:hypothetical protein